MICIETPLQTWPEYRLVILDFLQTDEDYLILSTNPKLLQRIVSSHDGKLPDLDLIQFCDLAKFAKGELGIREIHWKISNFVTTPGLINLLSKSLIQIQMETARKLIVRLNSMKTRRLVIYNLMKDFANLGIIVPHYIEPINSTVVISKTFAKALIEFNHQGYLSFERAYFALARTANYKCVRILDAHR